MADSQKKNKSQGRRTAPPRATKPAATKQRVRDRMRAGEHTRAIELATAALAATRISVSSKLDLLDLRAESYIAQGELDRAAKDAAAMLRLASTTEKAAFKARAMERSALVKTRKAQLKAAVSAATVALEPKAAPRTVKRQTANSLLEQRENELAIINSVQQALAAQLDMQGIYDAVGDKIREIFGRADVEIRIIDRQAGIWRFPYLTVRGERFSIAPNPIGDVGFGAHVLRTRETLVINENAEKALAKYRSHLLGPVAPKSMVFVPMIAGDQVRGMLQLADMDREHAFTDSDVRLLQTLASSMSVALENARLFDETQRLFKESEQRALETKEALERQTATAEVLRVISSSPSDLDPVYRTILERITRLCESQIGALFLFDGERLHAAAMHGMTSEFASILKQGRPRPSHETTTRLAALERRTVHVADLLSDSTFSPTPRDLYERENVRTVLSVPMLRESQLIGVITTWRREVRPFDDRQIGLVCTFADQAVIAIENARLFNETKEALERQTATADVLKVISESPTDVQPVFDAIAERAKTLCGAQISGVVSFDGEWVHLVAYHGVSREADDAMRSVFPVRIDGRTTSARAIRARAPVQIIDVMADPDYGAKDAARLAGFRANMAVPMLREGEVIGAINVCRAEVGPFPEKQVQLLQTFADQAVIAIENVRLFNETKEALERQTATTEILRVIASSPSDVQPVFDTIVRHAAELVGGMYTNVFRYDGEKIHMVATSTDNQEMLTLLRKTYPTQPDRSQMSGRAILEKAVVRMEDALDDPAYDKRHAVAGGWRRMLGVPMLRDGQPLGAFSSHGPRPARDLPASVDRSAQDLRRSGRDRDRERATVQRNEGCARQSRRTHARVDRVAGLPDSDQRRAAMHQRIADRRDARVRSNPRERDSAVRQPDGGRPSIRRPAGASGRDAQLVDRGARGCPPVLSGAAQPEAAQRAGRALRLRADRGGYLPRPGLRPDAGTARPLATHARRATAQGWRRRRRDHRHLAGSRQDATAADRSAQDVCGSGGDRHRERAADQRDEGSAGAANRHRRSAEGHQWFAYRCTAGAGGGGRTCACRRSFSDKEISLLKTLPTRR